MKILDINELLQAHPYPGRGIVLGRSADGQKAVIIYFIMGRSGNSRNRVFEATGDGIRTRAYDESKMVDPSLIIYHPVRRVGEVTVVTNGDQTDTIRDSLLAGKSYIDALRTRCYEPDGPNYTPRISGVVKETYSARIWLIRLERFVFCCSACRSISRTTSSISITLYKLLLKDNLLHSGHSRIAAAGGRIRTDGGGYPRTPPL